MDSVSLASKQLVQVLAFPLPEHANPRNLRTAPNLDTFWSPFSQLDFSCCEVDPFLPLPILGCRNTSDEENQKVRVDPIRFLAATPHRRGCTDVHTLFSELATIFLPDLNRGQLFIRSIRTSSSSYRSGLFPISQLLYQDAAVLAPIASLQLLGSLNRAF